MRYLTATLLVALVTPMMALAHCEVPCGIYTDDMRVKMIEEDCETIEKAMLQIEQLSAGDDVDLNQVARWISTKEDHANKVQGVRAALCLDARTADGARKWNDANALAISLRSTSEAELAEILDAWFAGEPSGDAEDVANVKHLDEI